MRSQITTIFIYTLPYYKSVLYYELREWGRTGKSTSAATLTSRLLVFLLTQQTNFYSVRLMHCFLSVAGGRFVQQALGI